MFKIIVCVLGLVLGGYFAVTKFYGYAKHEKKETATTSSVKSTPVPATPSPMPFRIGPSTTKPLPEWDIYPEKFRGQYGPNVIRTAQGLYEVGEMSVRGMVDGIRGRVIKLTQADGRTGYVVAEDEPWQATGTHTMAALPALTAGAASAKWEPIRSEFSERESARMREELARPIGGGR